MKNPRAKVREFAASIYPRPNEKGPCLSYSIRKDQYRHIVQYLSETLPKGGFRINGEPVGAELYDYNIDPDETENLSGKTKYISTEIELMEIVGSHVSYTQNNKL